MCSPTKALNFDTDRLWPACVACALQTLRQVSACGAKFARRSGACVDLSAVNSRIDRALEADRLACERLSEGDASESVWASFLAYRAAGAVISHLNSCRQQASVKASADFDVLCALAAAVRQALAPLAGVGRTVS